MGLTVSERKALIRKHAKRYRKSTKKQKGRILEEFVHSTDYSRKYAGWILRNWGTKRIVFLNDELIELVVGHPKKRRRRPRERIYDETVFDALKKVWVIFDCICGKRLVAVLKTMLPILEKFEEIELTDEVRQKLRHISAPTFDRLLATEKKKLKIKGKGHTKPGSLLKAHIPIRVFDGWGQSKPGFVEIDLVGHDGGTAQGEFIFTLNLTDIDSGWTEPRAVRNKAQKWTFEALMLVKQRLPFEILGIDSDNGSEFIDHHLYHYCIEHHIEFTRSRPYRKNDSCFVEQKNNSVVRRYAGHLRYDTNEQLTLLNEIYDRVRLMVNFFHPSMKLVSKTRNGAKTSRRYDNPTTPHQRLITSAHLPQEFKDALTEQFNELNPAELQREMVNLQQKLINVTVRNAKVFAETTK